jgi:RimJ/RimL family protein N-acetyltransferase
MVEVIYARKELIPSYYECLKSVAAERTFIEQIEPFPLDQITRFQGGLIAKEGPVYYAVEDGRVVGWADIFPNENPRLKHRASLGMGILKEYRGKGLGTQLLSAVLKKAKEFGLEKVELTVYKSNSSAVALYEKAGFEHEGIIRAYRKLDGIIYDAHIMGLFL